jgi:5-methylcytosine-specific restriction endonuclease McrA
MAQEETRICKACKNPKLLRSFGTTGRGGHRRRVCHTCRTAKRTPERRAAISQRHRKRRQENVPSAILADSRSRDKKKGFEGNDLTVEFVLDAVANGCTYCGDTKLRMTLDRVDGTLAHTQSNVVACCIRCNLLRGSMPYAAWLHLVPSVKEARELGLFGDWRSKPIRKALTDSVTPSM